MQQVDFIFPFQQGHFRCDFMLKLCVIRPEGCSVLITIVTALHHHQQVYVLQLMIVLCGESSHLTSFSTNRVSRAAYLTQYSYTKTRCLLFLDLPCQQGRSCQGGRDRLWLSKDKSCWVLNETRLFGAVGSLVVNIDERRHAAWSCVETQYFQFNDG